MEEGIIGLSTESKTEDGEENEREARESEIRKRGMVQRR